MLYFYLSQTSNPLLCSHHISPSDNRKPGTARSQSRWPCTSSYTPLDLHRSEDTKQRQSHYITMKLHNPQTIRLPHIAGAPLTAHLGIPLWLSTNCQQSSFSSLKRFQIQSLSASLDLGAVWAALIPSDASGIYYTTSGRVLGSHHRLIRGNVHITIITTDQSCLLGM